MGKGAQARAGAPKLRWRSWAWDPHQQGREVKIILNLPAKSLILEHRKLFYTRLRCVESLCEESHMEKAKSLW